MKANCASQHVDMMMFVDLLYINNKQTKLTKILDMIINYPVTTKPRWSGSGQVASSWVSVATSRVANRVSRPAWQTNDVLELDLSSSSLIRPAAQSGAGSSELDINLHFITRVSLWITFSMNTSGCDPVNNSRLRPVPTDRHSPETGRADAAAQDGSGEGLVLLLVWSVERATDPRLRLSSTARSASRRVVDGVNCKHLVSHLPHD